MEELKKRGGGGPLPRTRGGEQAFVAKEASQAPRPTEVSDGEVWHPTKGASGGGTGRQGRGRNTELPTYYTPRSAVLTRGKDHRA